MKKPMLFLAATLVSAGASAQVCVPDPEGDLVLTVSPSMAQVGELVTVTLTNVSTDCTYGLPTPCLIASVHAQDCDGETVLPNSCAPQLTPLGPGQSVMDAWDQKSMFGNQVAEGSYAFNVPVLDPNVNPLELCGLVQIGSGCVSPQAYGPGSAGTGGNVPAISSIGGFPALGNGSFQVAITNGLGGAFGLTVFGFAEGAFPLPFGTLHVSPLFGLFNLPLVLGGTPGEAGRGIGFVPVPIPADPTLLGAEIFFQGFLVDAGSSGGISHTEGLRVVTCQ